ncbi:hypothetical protein [Sphingomicrobium flavum]|uniref:hypothetical protein n=1 Tax=Sphingomicrobium flavum TaxID=1229164 RepID=UPI0021ADD417|nr:hypothetical protein [Sphingomicrobium flavum]
MILRILAAAILATSIAGCASTPPANPQDSFFAALQEHCGKAYEGKVVSDDPADADWRGKTLTVHFRECSDDAVHMPLHVGDDRSRTWIVTRTDRGLRLKHDHRHEDGSPDAVTFYGGDTIGDGTATRQHFPVDQESIALFRREGLDASVTNVWAMEMRDGMMAYELSRPSGRFFRAEIDLTDPVNPPPAPWGHE